MKDSWHAVRTPSVHYSYWRDGYGVSVCMDCVEIARLNANVHYGANHIVDKCGGDQFAAAEAICGLAVLAASDGRLHA